MDIGAREGARQKSIEVFCCYAREDQPLLRDLKKHLMPLQREGLITLWADIDINAGEEWEKEIHHHLNTAHIILLLISPDFLASDYCYNIEMQRALQRHEQHEAHVIPIILRTCDWQNALFAHLQTLPRDGKPVTEWPNQDAAFHDITQGLRRVITDYTGPVLSSVALSNRAILLKSVRKTWINGLLEPSLHQQALIALNLQDQPDALDKPWHLQVQEINSAPHLLPAGTSIMQVYDKADGGLLILGEPGAGKTTLLLELARILLERAEHDRRQRMPVVFHLSSWAEKRLPLSEWLIEELQTKYKIPRKIGKTWISTDQILPLLDGLDEVAEPVRPTCVQEINAYCEQHQDHGPLPIVVCCRSTDYQDLSTRVKLSQAISIQPLTSEQISSYLQRAGDQLEALRQTLHDDSELYELAQRPLMLSIFTLAYQKATLADLPTAGTHEAKLRQVFTTYVQRMLTRRGVLKHGTLDQFKHRLAFLAAQMQQHHQSVFYLEQMQPDWLPKVGPRSFYRVLAGGVSGGLLCGLIGAAVGAIVSSISALNNGPISFLSTPIPWPAITAGLIIGLIIGQILGSLIGLFRPKSVGISTVEVITWSWTNARLATIASIVGGSLGWLILFHSVNFITIFFNRLVLHVPFHSFLYWLSDVVVLLIFLIIPIFLPGICFMLMYLFTRRNLDGHRSIISRQRIWYAARRGTLVGIYMVCIGFTLLSLTSILTIRLVGNTDIRYDIYLVAVGCVSGLITGLIYGVSRRQLEIHVSIKPNQGIWRSLYNGGLVLLIVGLIVWLLYEIPVLVSYRLAVNQAPPLEIIDFPSNQFLTGVIVGISIGLFFGLLNGGIACIKHVLLRVFLWRARVLPWNCVRFLDYAFERILLRKVGGGYIFVHRRLLEYFASLATPFPEEAPAVAVMSEPPSVLSSTSQIDIGLPKEKPSLPVSRRKTGFNKEKRIAVLLVVVILLELTSGASIFYVIQANQIATQAQAYATATASVIAANPNPYDGGTLALYDPLSQPLNWHNYTDTTFGGACQFINGSYHISQSKPNRSYYCTADGDFSNFTFEVQMTISKGDCGGVVFREGPGGKHYYFSFCQDGSYSLILYVDHTGTNAKYLRRKSSSAINTGLNVSNVIAVVANGSALGLYVNKQKIDSVTDSTYSHGTIGLTAENFNNPTEVIFQNAKVWKL